jgi:hypothetical protein
MVDSSFPFAGGIAYQFGTLMPFRGGGVHTIASRVKRKLKALEITIFNDRLKSQHIAAIENDKFSNL